MIALYLLLQVKIFRTALLLLLGALHSLVTIAVLLQIQRLLFYREAPTLGEAAAIDHINFKGD